MGEPLERDRADEHRQGDGRAEDGRGGRDGPDVDEDARAQLPAAPALDVGAEGPLVLCAADEVRKRGRLDDPLGGRLVVAQAQRLHRRKPTFAGGTGDAAVPRVHRYSRFRAT
jgi:hypothetical protein